MKVYKKIMNGVAFVEKLILVLSTILIVVLTVGNVLSRKILHQSWSFTEELVVAVFVLITLLAAALAAVTESWSIFLYCRTVFQKKREEFCWWSTRLSVLHLPQSCLNTAWTRF